MYAEHADEVFLVVTDMMLPFPDGIAAIRALENMNPRVKVMASGGMATTC